VVESPGDVTFQAQGTVILGSGFSVGSGARFQAGSGGAPELSRRTYSYQDTQYFLTGASGPWPEDLTWTYDRIGNRLTETSSPTGSSGTPETDTYVYATNSAIGNTLILDQITLGVGGTRDYTWGAAGQTATFTYDGRSFLRHAEQTAGGTAVVVPVYDSSGVLHVLERQASTSEPTAAGRIRTNAPFQEFRMSTRLIRAPLSPALVLLWFLGLALPGCSDVGLGMVALELEVTAVSTTGAPVPDTVIWLEDHGLPSGADPAKRRHRVCTTDRAGKCAGTVKYTYPVRRWPWEKARGRLTPPNRFEVWAERVDKMESLGLLPPLTSNQLHGAEPASFMGAVASRGLGRAGRTATGRGVPGPSC